MGKHLQCFLDCLIKLLKFMVSVMFVEWRLQKTYRKTEGGDRTQVGAADIYEPRRLKHWVAR